VFLSVAPAVAVRSSVDPLALRLLNLLWAIAAAGGALLAALG